MTKLLTAIVLILFVSSCNQDDNNECIENRIANFDSEICNNGATVKRFTFQGHTTYAIHPGNCIADGADEILDAECNFLGFVGGFGGASEINGENYYDNATFEATVWQN